MDGKNTVSPYQHHSQTPKRKYIGASCFPKLSGSLQTTSAVGTREFEFLTPQQNLGGNQAQLSLPQALEFHKV